jgi:hypothetical protein
VLFAAVVAGLLEHSERPVVSFHMVVGAFHIFPTEEDDHFLELLFFKRFQRFYQECIALIGGIVDQPCPSLSCQCLGDTFFKEFIKLPIECPEGL